MTDMRRHSVDVPLSRTLVQLKRVRSLRDPATNSLSKYASPSDNMIWETASSNGVTLELGRSAHHQLTEEDEDFGAEATMGSERSFRAPNARTASYRKSSAVKIRGLNPPRNKQVHRARHDGHRKSLDSNHSNHSSIRQLANNMVNNVDVEKDEEEEVNSYERPNLALAEKTDEEVKMPSYSKFRNKSSAAMSNVGSPCMSTSEVHSVGSRRSTLGHGTEETRLRSNDVVESNFSGCGISYCWSGASKYRDLYSDSDGPEQPLLSTDGTEVAFQGNVPYTDTPRCLSQKFRPRSFSELIGHNVVAQSLLYSSCKGKVAPMYLFHGPRGTGKTSTARIFAAALNCVSHEEQRPCGFCKECVILFSGKSRDVKELDAAKMDRLGRVKALLKSASLVPYSSRFKVFIIDECHLLREDAWSAITKSLDEPYRHTVYIMITSDLGSLPRTSITHCQKFHFPKIKVADIVYRLERICTEEGLEFDHDGLYFIAAKSNGSLRDAEIMLDQLSLLGKKITISLAHELVGSVSDDELIELLDLALSSDTTNTVRRARELMGSAIDPLQLVSQLANLIMDILSGRCQSAATEVSKSFLGRYALAEVGIKKLRNALKILSETEKQLRTSRNQATWVTVALLQFGTNESNLVAEPNDLHAHSVTGYTDDWVSKVNSSSNFCHACNSNKSNCSERHCRRLKLANIWRRAIGKCRSRSARSFLRKEGFLSSVHVTEELAIAEVGFGHPDHLSRAEKMQSVIECALQHVLGCNVEIRFKLVQCPVRKDAGLKRQSFSFFSCSGRKQELSDSVVTDEDEAVRPGARETPLKGYSSSQQQSPFIMQRLDSTPTVHGCEDDARSTLTSNRSMTDDLTRTCRSEANYSKGVSEQGRFNSIQEPDLQPNCFSRTLKLQKKLLSSGAAHTICLRIQPHNKMDFLPKKEFDTYFCTYEPYEQCSRSNSRATYSSRDDDLWSKNSRFGSNMLCWRAPKQSI
ncbi:protein STICHEL-like 2 [Phragmites australis]|uniref:protein STICHEL-like 2 n=1 Tax=Phragmites australis TaxID=29695 RepID=UPI002D7A0F6D|nr:protein STICHEL-like 2 [Phragmites australis]XP_062225950.1 protein STICHEL-like 2 [Phragmites australis]